MSDTPRTDKWQLDGHAHYMMGEHCKKLERELAVEKAEKIKYRERAWHAESQLEARYGLRKEINSELGLTDETGDEALRKGLETIKAIKAERDGLKAKFKAAFEMQRTWRGSCPDDVVGMDSRDPIYVFDSWQPIATAPKGSGIDGPNDTEDINYVKPPIILLSTPCGCDVGYYDWYYHKGYGAGAGYRDSAWCDTNGEEIDPTHWMPLPEPPAITKETK